MKKNEYHHHYSRDYLILRIQTTNKSQILEVFTLYYFIWYYKYNCDNLRAIRPLTRRQAGLLVGEYRHFQHKLAVSCE